MEHWHDPIQHLKYLRQYLSQDSESIGFFLAAGCPLAVDMPEGQWPLIPDVAGLSRHLAQQLAEDPHFGRLLDEMEKAARNPQNIEEALSFVRTLRSVSTGGTVRGFDEEALQSLETRICRGIVEKLHVSLPDLDSPYHRVCKWINSIDRKVPIEFFTTNYDLLLEQALEDTGIAYFDGFVGSHRTFIDLRAISDSTLPSHWARLWKLHGSINWYTTGARQIHRSSEVDLEKSHLIYPSHLKYEESRKMPYLAMMDQLGRFIRRKSSFLILCGYSFGDNHINDTIVNALNANPTGMVLALMFGTFRQADGSERYSEAFRLARSHHNLNVWVDDRAIIGTNEGGWQRSARSDHDDDAQELYAFVHSVAGKDDQPGISSEVHLGDFAQFSTFLQRIIGSARVLDMKHGK